MVPHFPKRLVVLGFKASLIPYQTIKFWICPNRQHLQNKKQEGHHGPESLTWVNFRTKWIKTNFWVNQAKPLVTNWLENWSIEHKSWLLECQKGISLTWSSDLVFYPRWPNFKLVWDFITTNILTKFQVNWAKKVASRAPTKYFINLT